MLYLNIFEPISQTTLQRIDYAVTNAQEPLTIRINSQGGSVFSALSIFNLLKPLNVTIEIIGLCASAATLIACAGKVVRMGASAQYMIHSPSVMLFDSYDKQALEKMSSTMGKVEESILQVYRSRVKDFEMPGEEVWLSATQAKELGFVDEIINSTPQMNGGITMEENFFAKLKTAIMDGLNPQATVRDEELKRIRDLQSLKCENVAVNAVIEVAIAKGQSTSEVVDYVDAIKKAPTSQSDVADRIVNIIRDQMTSGAMNVSDSQAPTADELKKAQAQKMIAFANGLA